MTRKTRNSTLMAGVSALVAYFRRDSGSVAMIFGLVAVPLLLSAGAAVDFAHTSRAKTALQAAVDIAAVTAARNANLTQPARQQLASSAVMTNLGPLASRIGPTVVETEPAAGKFVVRATANVPTSVMRLMRMDSVPISASATAAATPAPTSKVCLFAKSTTASPGLLANSNASISAPNCEIHVASTGNPAATFNSGNVFNVSKLCVAGTQIIKNSVNLPALSTGCATATDPFESTLPAVSAGSCTVSNQNYFGIAMLSPGVYCGSFNFNGVGVVNLNPGLYVFKGANWNINVGWSIIGSGVTFYFADQNSYIQINSGVIASLTAPTSGTYKDILMFEPTGLASSSFSVNGGAGHSFEGLIYLPSRNVTFNSMANLVSERITIVVNSVILNTLTWNFQSAADRVIMAPAANSGPPRLVD